MHMQRSMNLERKGINNIQLIVNSNVALKKIRSKGMGNFEYFCTIIK